MIVLSAQNIQKSFGVNHVFKGASLTLQTERRVGIIGVNGSSETIRFEDLRLESV